MYYDNTHVMSFISAKHYGMLCLETTDLVNTMVRILMRSGDIPWDTVHSDVFNRVEKHLLESDADSIENEVQIAARFLVETYGYGSKNALDLLGEAFEQTPDVRWVQDEFGNYVCPDDFDEAVLLRGSRYMIGNNAKGEEV